ncbi:hypothetical protein NQZ68_016938 [Dissostichus eleginoides]|nr:hypothetical protein NQZ68_016938 [Dissostichus eleginoides]
MTLTLSPAVFLINLQVPVYLLQSSSNSWLDNSPALVVAPALGRSVSCLSIFSSPAYRPSSLPACFSSRHTITCLPHLPHLQIFPPHLLEYNFEKSAKLYFLSIQDIDFMNTQHETVQQQAVHSPSSPLLLLQGLSVTPAVLRTVLNTLFEKPLGSVVKCIVTKLNNKPKQFFLHSLLANCH